MAHVRLHLFELRPPSRHDPLDPSLVLLPWVRRAQIATPVARDRAIELEQLQRLGDLMLWQVDLAFDRRRRHRVHAFEDGQDLVHVDGRRERGAHEVFGDIVVLPTGQEDPVGTFHGATGSSDLLVVGDRRRGPLVVDDESEVRFVEAHPERDRRHERLHLTGDERVLQDLALGRGERRVVGPRIDPLRGEVGRDPLRVGDCQAIDDATPRESRQDLRQPGEALRLVREHDGIELERVARERAAKDPDAVAQLLDDVRDDPVVGRGGRGKDRHASVEQTEDPADTAVVRPKVVAPIGDAMRLVDDEQPDRALDARQDVPGEPLVGEALRGDEQDVDRVGGETGLHVIPFGLIAGVDRGRSNAQSLRHRDLVPHQRQQRADDQAGPVALVAADARRDPVHEALAPTRPLDDERSFTVLGDCPDRLPLAVAKGRVGAEHGPKMALEVVIGSDAGQSDRGRLGHEVGDRSSMPVLDA